MDDLNMEMLEDILENKRIRTVFQPIVSLDNGNILGYEALSRITGQKEPVNPEDLFIAAYRHRRLWDVELLCRTTALETAFNSPKLKYDKKLFLNVSQNIIHDPLFRKGFTRDFLAQYQISPGNLVFEITEKSRIADTDGFRATISHYKSQSFKIAVDDAGAGYSGLNLISDIHPDFIKLDMNLIRGIHKDDLKYALVKGMLELSGIAGIALIAEGIEEYEELSALVNMGVQYGQGYFIQKPEQTIREIDGNVLLTIQSLNRMKKDCASPHGLSGRHIRELCVTAKTLSPETPIKQADEIFRRDENCIGLCVLEGQLPLGIFTREKLVLKLSGSPGAAAYRDQPIRLLMDKDFLSVEGETLVSEVIALAMSRPNDRLYDYIVVTENGSYIGIVTIKDLLQKAVEPKETAVGREVTYPACPPVC